MYNCGYSPALWQDLVIRDSPPSHKHCMDPLRAMSLKPFPSYLRSWRTTQWSDCPRTGMQSAWVSGATRHGSVSPVSSKLSCALEYLKKLFGYNPILKIFSFDFYIEQFFVKSFSSSTCVGTIFSDFFYPCYGIVFNPTFSEVCHVRQTWLVGIYVAQMSSLSFMYFLFRFSNVLFLAFLASQTVHNVACLACYRVTDYESFVCGGDLYCVAERA